MNDGGWILGLMTTVAIGVGAWAFASAALAFSNSPKAKVPPPRPIENADKPSDLLRDLLQKQASQAAERHRVEKAMAPLEAWIQIAIRHLMHLWPTMSYDEASREMRGYLADDIKAWPSDEYIYTPDSAREMAVEYTRDYGEQFGANE